MAYLVSALLFSLILAIANSDPLYAGHPYNTTIGPFNLHTVATLTIEHNTNISICIVAAEFGLPAFSFYSEDVCLWYFQANSSGTLVNTTESVPLLDEHYQIGIYYLDVAQIDPKHNATVQVFVFGNVCGSDEIFDNSTKQCLPVTPIGDWNETKTIEFNKGETKIFVWDNPSNVGFFEFSYAPGGLLSAELIVAYARFNAAPSAKYYDGHDVNGKLTINTPKPGKWVFSLRALDAGKVTIFFTGRVCGEFLAGKDCTIHVRDAVSILNLTLINYPVYFRVVVNKTNINSTVEASLLVSVATANSSLLPQLYASRGQIPDKNTADIKNCNRGFCDEVRSILYNSTKNGEEWFIAVIPSVPGNVTAALWFGETCIPDCQLDSHGLCQPSGLCSCEIDYDGINCAHSKGLGPQYIVLIIIASLVVASAFIGFVAWAYMRQKRGAYEPLT